MPLPVWTEGDEETWQEMMERAAEAKRRSQPVPVQEQYAEAAPAGGEQNHSKSPKASAPERQSPAPARLSWQGLKQWYDEARKGDAETAPPPPAPRPPSVDQKAWNESIDQYHPGRGNETTATMAGRIYNETHVMKDSPQENEPLSAAQQKMAHSRINAIRKFGRKVQGLASMMEPLMQGPGYESTLEQTRKSVEDHLMGNDPTAGAFFYNMRTPEEVARNGPFQGETVHTVSGPYESKTINKYINTYGDPEVKAPKTRKRPAVKPAHGPKR